MKNHHTWCIPIFSVQIRKKTIWHEMPSLYKCIGSAGNGQFGLDTFVQTLFEIYDPHDKGIKIQKIKNLLAPSKNPNTCDISLVWPYMYICVCCQLFALVLYDHILVDQSNQFTLHILHKTANHILDLTCNFQKSNRTNYNRTRSHNIW